MNAQQQQAATAAIKIADAWAAAERRGDAGELDRWLTPDFTAVGPRGFVLSKDQLLQRFLTGDLHYDSLSWQDASARVYGAAAIVIGRQEITGSSMPAAARRVSRHVTTCAAAHGTGGLPACTLVRWPAVDVAVTVGRGSGP